MTMFSRKINASRRMNHGRVTFIHQKRIFGITEIEIYVILCEKWIDWNGMAKQIYNFILSGRKCSEDL